MKAKKDKTPAANPIKTEIAARLFFSFIHNRRTTVVTIHIAIIISIFQ